MSTTCSFPSAAKNLRDVRKPRNLANAATRRPKIQCVNPLSAATGPNTIFAFYLEEYSG